MASTINERILIVFNQSGISQTAISNKLRVSPAYIWKIYNKGSVPSERLIDDICREFGVSEQWLRTGEGEIYERASDKELELVEMFGAILREKGGESFEMQTIAAMMKFGQREWEALHIVLQYINSLDDDPKEKTPEE